MTATLTWREVQIIKSKMEAADQLSQDAEDLIRIMSERSPEGGGLEANLRIAVAAVRLSKSVDAYKNKKLEV